MGFDRAYRDVQRMVENEKAHIIECFDAKGEEFSHSHVKLLTNSGYRPTYRETPYIILSYPNHILITSGEHVDML